FNIGSCSGVGTSGGGTATIPSGHGASCSSGVATITLTAALPSLYVSGSTVVVSSVSGGSGFNGTWTIASINTGTNQFTYTSASVTTITTGFSGATSITCTIGTAAVCTDTTHTASVSAGDLVVILGQNNSGTASASEALANIRVSLEKQ